MSQAKTLKEKLAELEGLVEWFDRGDELDVEQAIDKFNESSQLAESIKEDIDNLENKVTVLKKRFDESE